jgi:hypothetical protein
MTKRAMFSLAEMLCLQIQRRDTRYRLAIPVLVRVCCTLFKLAQGCSIFICSELFAVGKSSVSQMLRDTVYAVNETLRHEDLAKRPEATGLQTPLSRPLWNAWLGWCN